MSAFSRRKLITTGLAAAGGASGLAAAVRLADRYGLIPPDHGGIYGAGTTLTYASQRLLTRHSLAREFPPSQISKAPFAKLRPFASPAFDRLRAGGFVDWRIDVDGMVARPSSFSLAELRSFPPAARSHSWPARRAGHSSLSGTVSRYPTSCVLPELSRKPVTWFTFRSSPNGGRASIWPMPCIPRLFWSTA